MLWRTPSRGTRLNEGVVRIGRVRTWISNLPIGVTGFFVRYAAPPVPSRLVSPFYDHEWQQPWLRKPPENSPEGLAWILEIGDVRVHSPETRTALVIPPESRIRKGTVVDRLYSSTDRQEEIRECRTGLQTKDDSQPNCRRVGLRHR